MSRSLGGCHSAPAPVQITGGPGATSEATLVKVLGGAASVDVEFLPADVYPQWTWCPLDCSPLFPHASSPYLHNFLQVSKIPCSVHRLKT